MALSAVIGSTAFFITDGFKKNAEEKETALRAAKAMGLGVAGVDMLQSKRGPLVMEVNSSPGLEGIEKATGKDIAGKIIQYMERNQFRNGIQKDRINA